MDYFHKIILMVWLIAIAGFAQPVDKDIKTLTSEEIEDLIKEETEGENNPTKVLSKQLTLIHGFNDTQINENGQKVESTFPKAGMLSNVIVNRNGNQTLTVINQIQYNFYFWVSPKDNNETGLKKDN